jgi:endonuclease-3
MTPQRNTRSSSRFIYEETNEPIKLETTETSESRINPSRKRKHSSSSPLKPSAIKVETISEIESIQPSKPKKRQPAKIEPPTGWEALYSAMKEMRKNISAPVDTMGCERLADKNDTPRVQRFQTLVSLMLSSQTKDTVTAAAIRDMQSSLPGGLNLESILDVEPNRLNEFIGKIGFHNTKTKNVFLSRFSCD